MSILMVLNGIFMSICLPFSWYFGGEDFGALLGSALIAISLGTVMWLLTRNSINKELRKREGYLVVTIGWLVMSLIGTLPYMLSGEITNFTDAFFETLSGFSTTGATILEDIESVSKGILLWRSMSQWIGGMGIIVLTVAILPILGIGGMQLFVAEVPGISPDKFQPRIKETAKRLWIIYIGFTGLELIFLMVGDMTFFDALNHSLTTMASGGFSTKNSSIAYYDSAYIDFIIVMFMFLAGTNFTMIYFGLHGKLKKVFQNQEFRAYGGFCLVITIFCTLGIWMNGDENLIDSFRYSIFQVISVITTTGYITKDYTAWTPLLTMLFLFLMFVGASAGSTAGGIKIIRHLILVKNSFLEFNRQIHPSAILPLRLNGKTVNGEITFQILAFVMLYLTIFALGSLGIALLGVDLVTALGAAASCLGNVGPGIGSVGPVANFAHMPTVGKWILSLLMLLGRLELFTVLILFTPFFWRKT